MPVDIEDIHSLRVFLQDTGHLTPDEKCSLQILEGGVSNKTVLMTRESGEAWVIKQALTKLRVEQEWYCSPDRLEIEFKAMVWFSKNLPAGTVPMPVFYHSVGFILAMDAVSPPCDNLKVLLMNGRFHMEWIGQLGVLLAKIHTAGRGSVEAEAWFGDRSFFKTLRLEAYYRATSIQLPETLPFFDKLIDETLAIRETVVHGDFSPKNVLIKDEKLILLDHEVMHYGDPAFDIGFCLCLLLSFANHLEPFRNNLIQAARIFWSNYLKEYQHVDKSMESRAIKHTLGCMLARVKGLSPLEYFDDESKRRQVGIGLELINTDMTGILELTDVFSSKLTGEE